MGICGSGCASIALIAHKQGYQVSGCDLSTDSYYAEALKKCGIPIEKGHSASHIQNDTDIVAVSPAIFDMSPDNEELREADRRGILMTWQEFMGKYLQKDKRVIAFAGTHGKTTTTFLTAEILIDAGLDPTVEGGSVYKKWKSGGRFGSSDLFICEADEFNRNFFHYEPETAVITNVEMDHPECFRDFEDIRDAFVRYLTKNRNLKTLILSGESGGALEVLEAAWQAESVRSATVIAVFREKEKELPIQGMKVLKAVYRILEKRPEGTRFTLEAGSRSGEFLARIPGEYNVINTVMSVIVGWTYGVSDDVIQSSLDAFEGAGRRFDLVGSMQGVPVYDDYAHHPTEIRSLLTMCREYYPERRLLAVFEPHQISRLRLMFRDYVDSLTVAHHVIIAKTHIGREMFKGVTPISKEDWEGASDRILYEEDPVRQKAYAKELIQKGECDMILVIGAANSYKISRFFVEED
ncbi:MAG: UDP-N-acetylmuramate--L-alanine ligase [Lachnospiraceae bacterium]|nr:UDP-N-acetylmuramate--L-alanine ligase [Lachnospiraceae bacterium]